MMRTRVPVLLLAAALVMGGACKKSPPIAKPTPPPPTAPSPFPNAPASTTPAAPTPVPEPPPIPMEPAVTADPLVGSAIDEINKNSPLKAVFFALDSEELDALARATLNEDAQVLKKYPQWVVTVEGHTDERGSAEYNLALGERRALAAKNYLVSLGIGAERLRTVSYGKEFPFDPGKDESAFAKNRRAHFMLTSK
jgi:peptidoglycan-associated lipoprotein